MKPADTVIKLCDNLQFQNDINNFNLGENMSFEKNKAEITYHSQGFEILRL